MQIYHLRLLKIRVYNAQINLAAIDVTMFERVLQVQLIDVRGYFKCILDMRGSS